MVPTRDEAPATHVVDATMFWSPTGGGVRRYLLTKQAWFATQSGWRHTIAVPLKNEPAARPLHDEFAAAPHGSAGLALARLPAWPLPGSGGYRLPLRRRLLADRLVSLTPDLIEAGDPYVVGWAAADAARRRGIPAVAYCHSNLERMARLAAGRALAPAAGRVARRYARRLYERFDLVLAPSERMRAHLVDWGVARTACQPLGVDTRVFEPSKRSTAWRQALGFGSADRVLVYAGRFAPEKHLDVLAAAVDRLGEPYTLVAIGAGPAPPRGARVRVVPFVAGTDTLATALASADAFVHAGDQETFGLSALEAMACGVPIVVRSAEGLGELVDASVGIGVERGDAAAFAAAIDALFARDREAPRRAARRRAEAHDWSRVLPQLLDRYRSLLRDERVERPAPAGATTSAVAGTPGSAPSRPARHRHRHRHRHGR